ncbi:type III effector protein XopC2, partial [Xanthomonas oryzae pv. oryzae]
MWHVQGHVSSADDDTRSIFAYRMMITPSGVARDWPHCRMCREPLEHGMESRITPTSGAASLPLPAADDAASPRSSATADDRHHGTDAR